MRIGVALLITLFEHHLDVTDVADPGRRIAVDDNDVCVLSDRNRAGAIGAAEECRAVQGADADCLERRESAFHQQLEVTMRISLFTALCGVVLFPALGRAQSAADSAGIARLRWITSMGGMPPMGHAWSVRSIRSWPSAMCSPTRVAEAVSYK